MTGDQLPWPGSGPALPPEQRPTEHRATHQPTTQQPTTEQPTEPPGPGRFEAPPRTFYDEVGGHPTFDGIVHRFYRGVAADPLLEPMYPEDDLGPAEVRLRMFLEQYWGGPRTYSQLRGHPRLRMRHAPFVIGPAERDAWLRAMRHAVDGADLTPEQDARLWSYLVMAADSMVNSPH